jgi:hypothetical protein
MTAFPRARTLRVSLPLIALLALAACGGSSSSSPGPEEPVAGLLRKVSAPGELEASLKTALTTVNTSSADVLASAGGAPEPAPPSVGNFTGTYTQEANVDEFDVVRYDGEHLYVAPRRFYHCCFAAMEVPSDGAVNTGSPAVASIRMLATDPASASATLAGTIPLDEGVSIQGMYVDGNRLFALTAELFYGTYGDLWSSLAIWAPEKLGFHIYDVTDKSAPVQEIDVTIDGVFVDSRRIGNVVYILSRYAPNIEGLIWGPQTAADQAHNQALLANLALDDLLPKITIDGVEQTLVDPANCYVSNDERIPDYPVITSITAVPIDNPEGFVNTCYNEEVYGVYVSENAIYFPQILGFELPDVFTRIHKFGLSGTSVSYSGSADIEGQLWVGGQQDFRMSEYNGDLRVLSSKFDRNSTDFVDHLLYILRESATEPALDIVGSLPNANRPEPIGKPNETLFGVRFLGDRAFAVTFLQIDPLYVFDLADPADPRIAGTLEVTGFSDFLHPVTDELLLGLGTPAAGGGVKLELFDISDLSAPLSRGTVTIGDQNTYSEARWNRHAFTYQADIAGVDRFTIPATTYSELDGQLQFETSLHLFEVHDKLTPPLASLVPAGQLTPPVTSEYGFADRNRAFLHDDAIYYVLEDNVWSAFWLSPTMVNGPF